MTLTYNLVVSFIQQEIFAAADAAIRKLKEENPDVKVSRDAIASTMRAAIKESTDRHYKKLSKIVAVATPALTSDWLKEVREPKFHSHWSTVCYGTPQHFIDIWTPTD